LRVVFLIFQVEESLGGKKIVDLFRGAVARRRIFRLPLLFFQGELELFLLSQLRPARQPPHPHRAAMASSTSSCDATAVPFTLLGALLTAGPAAWPACVGGGRAFLRDYAQRGTNALLWAVLLAVTWVLLLRVAALLRIWALGSRIPGPRALLADPGLADVLRTGGDITGW